MTRLRMITEGDLNEVPPARLAEDERLVRDWFDRLGEPARRRRYSLAELRAALSIPVTRLRVVIYRLGWQPRREQGFGMTTYFKPPNSHWPSDVEDYRSVISKLRGPS